MNHHRTSPRTTAPKPPPPSRPSSVDASVFKKGSVSARREETRDDAMGNGTPVPKLPPSRPPTMEERVSMLQMAVSKHSGSYKPRNGVPLAVRFVMPNDAQQPQEGEHREKNSACHKSQESRKGGSPRRLPWRRPLCAFGKKNKSKNAGTSSSTTGSKSDTASTTKTQPHSQDTGKHVITVRLSDRSKRK